MEIIWRFDDLTNTKHCTDFEQGRPVSSSHTYIIHTSWHWCAFEKQSMKLLIILLFFEIKNSSKNSSKKIPHFINNSFLSTCKWVRMHSHRIGYRKLIENFKNNNLLNCVYFIVKASADKICGKVRPRQNYCFN